MFASTAIPIAGWSPQYQRRKRDWDELEKCEHEDGVNSERYYCYDTWQAIPEYAEKGDDDERLETSLDTASDSLLPKRWTNSLRRDERYFGTGSAP